MLEKKETEGHAGGLTREHVVWAYRLLLDRDPENEDVIGPKLAGSRDTKELRHHLMTSAEFLSKNRDYAHTNDPTIIIKEIAARGGTVRLFVDLSDHVIGLSIVRDRYEQNEVGFVSSVLRPGDSAIDVGAHIGFFTIQMASMVGPLGAVAAFEPFAPNADLLERSIVENRFEGRVMLRRMALGASSGTGVLTFPVETLNTGGAYLLPNGGTPLPGNLEQEVALAALDDLDVRRPVRLIKMDVEGAEPKVIEGAARLLKEDRPVILCELHPVQLERASGTTPATFIEQLHAAGYRAHGLRNGIIDQPLETVSAEEVLSVALLPV